MRLVLALTFLVVLFTLPFLFFGAVIEDTLSGEGAREWMQSLGGWGLAAGIGLLCLDLFLPVPATAVLFAMGVLYGPFVGATAGFVGTCASGFLGYFLARRLGRRFALRFLGRAELRNAERMTREWGGTLVACSRWVPILPEVISVSVGLSRMDVRRFALALAIGNAPLALVFAGLGAWANDSPGVALLVAAAVSIVGWRVTVSLSRRPVTTR